MSENFNKEMKRMIAKNFSIQPTEVDGINNYSFWYYRQKLYEKIYSRFKFIDFPKTWDKDYFREMLFQNGVIYCTNTTLGNVALDGSYSGLNVYGKPTDVTFSNPVLGIFIRRIAIDCEPIYFSYFNQSFNSVEDLVRRYALLFAQIDASLNTTLINSRVSHIFTSSNKQVVNTMKSIYDDVTSGKPACFALFDREIEPSLQTWFNNVKNTYVGNEILVTKRTLMNEFCTEIGISNANLDKKERLNSEEVNANNEETMTLIEMWIETMNDCFKRCNVLFPDIKVRVELRKEDVNEPL